MNGLEQQFYELLAGFGGLASIQKLLVYLVPMVYAIVLHEVAHGWVAKQLGDPTAFMLGRLSLNPIKHVDWLGTIIVPLVLALLPMGFIFGWAKPVPVNPRSLNHPKRDMLWVALAGPAANLLMALAWALSLQLVLQQWLPADFNQYLGMMALAGVFINIGLMCFNLLPLLPLDGGRVVASLLPNKLEYTFSRIEPYGFWILVVLLQARVLDQPLGVMRKFSWELVSWVTRLPVL